MTEPTPNNLLPRPPYRLVQSAGHQTHSADEDISLHDHRCETQSSTIILVVARSGNDVCPRRDNLRAREGEEWTMSREDSPAPGGNKIFRNKDEQAATEQRTSYIVLHQVLSTLLSSVSVVVFRWLTWKSNDFSYKGTVFESCADEGSKSACHLACSTCGNGTEKLCYSESDQLKEWKSCSHVNVRSSCQKDKLFEKSRGDYEDVPNSKSRGCSADDFFGLAWLFSSRQSRPVGVLAAVYPVGGQNTDQAPGTGGIRQAPRDSPASSPYYNRYQLPDIIYDLPHSAFSKELNRLGTFFNFPSDSPVFAIRLAHVGFLRLPDGAIVCYFCELRHDEWHAGDSPFEVHKQLSPDCPVVTGRADDNQLVAVLPLEQVKRVMELWSISGPLVLPRDMGQQDSADSQTADTGSVPTATPSGARALSSSHLADLHPAPQGSTSVSNAAPSSAFGPRASAVGTTSDSRSQQPRQLLQNAGLAEDNDGPPPTAGPSRGNNSAAAPSAAASGRVIESAILDGTAQPRATSISSEPSSSSASAEGTSASGQQKQVVTYQNLGIITEVPKRRDMANIGVRIESFENWTSRSHRPHELAQAGFFYAGYGDCARCFFCGGGLKNWERGDNPWAEHARWFKDCPYVRVCQGQDFIDVVQQLNVSGQQISMAQVREAIDVRRAEGERIQEIVVDPAVSSLLEVGVSREAVDSAVQRAQTEGQLLTANQLVTNLQAAGLMPPMDDEAASAISVHDLQGQVDQLVTENSEIRQQRMCKVCLDKESCIVFLPCGHLVCCAECSPVLSLCAVCRIKIQGRVRAFPAGA